MQPTALLSSLMAVALLILATHLGSTGTMRPGFSHLSEASDRAEQLRRIYFPNMDHDDSSSVEAAPYHRDEPHPSLFSRLMFWDRTEDLPAVSSAQEALDRAGDKVKNAKERLELLQHHYKIEPRSEWQAERRYQLALDISDAEDALTHAQREYNYAVIESNGQEGEMLHHHPTLDEEIQGATHQAEATFNAEWDLVRRRAPSETGLLWYMALNLPYDSDPLEVSRSWLHHSVQRQAYEDLFVDLWSKDRWANAVKLVSKLGGALITPSDRNLDNMPSAVCVQLRDAYDALLEAERNRRWGQTELLNEAEHLLARAESKIEELSAARKELGIIGSSPRLKKMKWSGQNWEWIKRAVSRRDAEVEENGELCNESFGVGRDKGNGREKVGADGSSEKDEKDGRMSHRGKEEIEQDDEAGTEGE